MNIYNVEYTEENLLKTCYVVAYDFRNALENVEQYFAGRTIDRIVSVGIVASATAFSEVYESVAGMYD